MLRRQCLTSFAAFAATGSPLKITGATLFTWLVGSIVQHYSYDSIFFIMGFMHPAAFLAFRYLALEPVRIEDGARD